MHLLICGVIRRHPGCPLDIPVPMAFFAVPHTHFLLTSIIPTSHLTGFIISSGVSVILSICVKAVNACKHVDADAPSRASPMGTFVYRTCRLETNCP